MMLNLKINKLNIKEVCEVASTMSGTVICSGPLPVRRSDEIVDFANSMAGCLSGVCKIRFIDNWKIFGADLTC